jgi:glutaredoxin-like protein NrdH
MITVYTKPGCGACEQTQYLMRKRGLTFTVVDITTDEQAANLLRDKRITKLPYVVTDHDEWTEFRYDKIKDIPR